MPPDIDLSELADLIADRLAPKLRSETDRLLDRRVQLSGGGDPFGSPLRHLRGPRKVNAPGHVRGERPSHLAGASTRDPPAGARAPAEK